MSIRAILQARSDAETDDHNLLIERRTLRLIYNTIPPYHVMFAGDRPLADPHAREILREWCHQIGAEPKSYLLSPKRSIYFHNEADAVLCRITFA